MKHSTKWIALLLAGALVTASFAACSGKTDSEDGGKEGQSQTDEDKNKENADQYEALSPEALYDALIKAEDVTFTRILSSADFSTYEVVRKDGDKVSHTHEFDMGEEAEEPTTAYYDLGEQLQYYIDEEGNWIEEEDQSTWTDTVELLVGYDEGKDRYFNDGSYDSEGDRYVFTESAARAVIEEIGELYGEGLTVDQYMVCEDGVYRLVSRTLDADGELIYGVEYDVEFGDVSVELPASGAAPDVGDDPAPDLSTSAVHGITYEEMGTVVLDAFTRAYYQNGALEGTADWHDAEIVETYLDAYEQTGNDAYLGYAQSILQTSYGAEDPATDWCSKTTYNDDVAWLTLACIRVYLLTDEEIYLTVAQNNFDKLYARGYSDDLGGGLWWKNDVKLTKTSCIQCPASIAACLIGQATGDDRYYNIAKSLMDWEFEQLFDSNTGAVYDSIDSNGSVITYASTYNQGSFVGACMLLHEKYGDQKYIEYADKAVEYAVASLSDESGVLNGETNNFDLSGFKGILTRWFYRYAEYTDQIDIQQWLQFNADVAFGNRNADDLIWSAWAEETSEDVSSYSTFGLSTAAALLFNCEPWW